MGMSIGTEHFTCQKPVPMAKDLGFLPLGTFNLWLNSLPFSLLYHTASTTIISYNHKCWPLTCKGGWNGRGGKESWRARRQLLSPPTHLQLLMKNTQGHGDNDNTIIVTVIVSSGLPPLSSMMATQQQQQLHKCKHANRMTAAVTLHLFNDNGSCTFPPSPQAQTWQWWWHTTSSSSSNSHTTLSSSSIAMTTAVMSTPLLELHGKSSGYGNDSSNSNGYTSPSPQATRWQQWLQQWQ